jgi:hypothetical protein
VPVVEFSFKAFPIPPSEPSPRGQIAWRPVTSAVIWTPGSQRVFRSLVLLDTGADSCVFPAAFAAFLGIDLFALKKNVTAGVGSSGNVTYYTDLEISLGRGIQFRSYVGFTDALDRLGMGLLGQSGFFDYYNVCFYQSQRRFTIETIPPDSVATNT